MGPIYITYRLTRIVGLPFRSGGGGTLKKRKKEEGIKSRLSGSIGRFGLGKLFQAFPLLFFFLPTGDQYSLLFLSLFLSLALSVQLDGGRERNKTPKKKQVITSKLTGERRGKKNV